MARSFGEPAEALQRDPEAKKNLLVRCFHLPALGQDADVSDPHLPRWSFLTKLSNGCRHFFRPELFGQLASGGHRNIEPISSLWKVLSVNISPSFTEGKVWTVTRLKYLGCFKGLIGSKRSQMSNRPTRFPPRWGFWRCLLC